jgi:DNA-binding CsgD family transcriptional regulator
MQKHKGYWQVVLAEVLNKDNHDHSFLYTNLGSDENGGAEFENDSMKRGPKRDRVVLDGEFSGIYLTPREVDCLSALASGRTVKHVARDLELSHRTVEFYLKNIKAKFGCTTKGELLAIVAEADLLSSLNQEIE